MAAISTNAEYMQHCVVKYWTRLSQRWHLSWYSPSWGERSPQPRFFTSFLWFALLQSSMVRIPGTITSTVNVLGNPRTIAKLSAT